GDYRLRSESTIKTPMGDQWAIKLSLIDDYDSDPESDTIEKNETSYDDYINLRHNNSFLTRTICSNEDVDDEVGVENKSFIEKLKIDYKLIESLLTKLNYPIRNGECKRSRVRKKVR
ncbi:MAG: DUF481 domain-containing protein, partial [Nitrososphaeraceae archaeon]|nr:DUF481 domain-containing protein [Nitrososphaeraceae archaeon]